MADMNGMRRSVSARSKRSSSSTGLRAIVSRRQVGTVIPGIAPVVEGIPGFRQPIDITVRPLSAVPLALRGTTVTLYAVVVEAGTIPPVYSLSELTPGTTHVLLIDTSSAEVR